MPKHDRPEEPGDAAAARRKLETLDDQLAAAGAYLSYPTPHDPVREEFYGPAPAKAIDEILEVYAAPQSCVLDLGCGAGFTLCHLARRAREVWGIDEDAKCIEAARLRAQCEGLCNVRLVHGGVGDEQAIAKLSDNAFHLGFSRRGPNLLPSMMGKLREDAIWIQEVPRWMTGMNELMGQDKRFFLPHARGDESWIVDFYARLGFTAASIHTWFYEQYFRDVDHLAGYLSSAWYLAHRGYDPARDRDALELYGRYNMTEHGIRVTRSRLLGVYRRLGDWPLPADNSGARPSETEPTP